MNDKLGRRIFKTGAVLLIVIAAVHSLSLIRERTPANDTERQLFELMTNYKFNLMGTMRSMSELMSGFSAAFGLAVLGFGLLDIAVWSERARLLKKVALANSLWLAAMLVVSLHYFFLVPTSFLALALVIFVFAWWKLPASETT
jgi:hypothetical protein